MTTTADPYRDWDAAYVLGSLSPNERREFELHIEDCKECSAYVTEIAGISGILSVVSNERAAELLVADTALADPDDPPMPATLYPNVVSAVRRNQRRSRIRVASAAAGGLLLAASIVFGIFVATGASVPWTDHGTKVTMAQTVPSPITAVARLTSEPWGTKIEVTCTYAEPATPPPADGPQPPFEYALYVTDQNGEAVQQATWSASPGSVITATGTTSLTEAQISKVEIKFVLADVVILEGKV